MRHTDTTVCPWARGLLGETIEDIDELAHLLATLGLAFGQRVGDARVHVIFEDRQADAIQRGFGGGKLLQDLDARPWLLDHPANSADLAFDAIQTCYKRLLFGRAQHVLRFVLKLLLPRGKRQAAQGCHVRQYERGAAFVA